MQTSLTIGGALVLGATPSIATGKDEHSETKRDSPKVADLPKPAGLAPPIVHTSVRRSGMSAPPRLRITKRDIAILHSLSTARFLTAQTIEWLHFPDWRARWEQHTAAHRYYPRRASTVDCASWSNSTSFIALRGQSASAALPPSATIMPMRCANPAQCCSPGARLLAR